MGSRNHNNIIPGCTALIDKARAVGSPAVAGQLLTRREAVVIGQLLTSRNVFLCENDDMLFKHCRLAGGHLDRSAEAVGLAGMVEHVSQIACRSVQPVKISEDLSATIPAAGLKTAGNKARMNVKDMTPGLKQEGPLASCRAQIFHERLNSMLL